MLHSLNRYCGGYQLAQYSYPYRVKVIIIIFVAKVTHLEVLIHNSIENFYGLNCFGNCKTCEIYSS